MAAVRSPVRIDATFMHPFYLLYLLDYLKTISWLHVVSKHITSSRV